MTTEGEVRRSTPMASGLDSCEDDGVRSGGEGGCIDCIQKKIDTHLERYRETHDDKKRGEPGPPEIQDGGQTDL